MKMIRNVPDEVFESWQKNKRKGDGEQLCALLGLTAPTITKALKYGSVAQSYLVTAITDFFTKRVEREIADAKKLTELINQQNI